MSICHLLLTRFNIQYEQGDEQGLQPKWIEDRLRLFEQYCLPAVLSQTCRDFEWIILGDIRTPETYKIKINRYTSLSSQIHVLWWPFDAADEDYHIPYQQLGTEYARKADILITSRLDNDDVIPACYMERVQELAQKGVEGFVSFPIGKQTFVHSKRSYRVRYVQNHFTSRIEKTDFKTVMAYNHALVDTGLLHLVETEEPMWEEIVHGGNVINDYMPKYHYYATGLSDVIDLSCRWIRFQTNRLVRFAQTHLVGSHKR